MRTRLAMAAAATAAGAVLVAQMNAEGAGGCTPSTGADVIVGQLSGVVYWGNVGNIEAYSVGTTSCNIGDTPLQWDRDTANHPVIGQHLYRLRDGRFEQIGLSWLKHGYAALTETLCCFCIPPGTNQLLGVGCSDPYGSVLNGTQQGFSCGAGFICGGLGPRYEVNAATGAYAFPYDRAGEGLDVVDKRLQVHRDDIDPALNAGALYFAEGHYVTPDDAAAGNHYNNTSYNQVLVSAGGHPWLLSLTGPTTRELPALYAWRDNDPDVLVEPVDDQSAGRFYLGSRATSNGDGTWHYEYALYNMNSHRCARELGVPADAAATISNVGFHDVRYHSGDGEGGVTYDGTDWPAVLGPGAVSWSTDTEAQNPNANAVRWGTLYNFRFDADTGPQPVTATIGLFRAGGVAQLSAATIGPSAFACPWDLDADDDIGVTDLLVMLGLWGQDPGGPPDFDGSGVVDVPDLLKLLGRWGPCP